MKSSNMATNKFSKLVSWSRSHRKVVDRSYAAQLWHRVVNIFKPTHFQKQLLKSVEKTLEDSVKSEADALKFTEERSQAKKEPAASEPGSPKSTPKSLLKIQQVNADIMREVKELVAKNSALDAAVVNRLRTGKFGITDDVKVTTKGPSDKEQVRQKL